MTVDTRRRTTSGNGVTRGRRVAPRQAIPTGDPLWYRDAIIYELHVRAFADSNGDGIGDFRGLAGKLDYLADLGVTALWLLPFYPSPGKDDGYDIADFTSVNPDYGSLADVRTLIREAHRRGLRVITELVCNHTSDQHPWFQRARRARPGSAARDFYVWSDTPERYGDARIIFKDFESSNWTWDGVAGAYYWHRFYHHQPDLNFESPKVREAIKRTMDFWLEMGVDGLRLDAIPYLYERNGTNCENLPETHAFLQELRRHVDERHVDRMFLAEANQWPEDAAAYFGAGDECHMAFHFPVMPRLYMSLRMEDRYPILDILEQTPEIPETAQWALFLRNHDELTLEMVTDEERDYMYRVYAGDPQMRINLGIRRRLAPLLGNHRRRIELMNALLFSMPGTPVLYYGDEIGMGDNVYLGDRNGVRTPMQWSADRNAGFSSANRQKLYLPVIIDPEYHYEAVNVDAQQNNPHSLLWWTKRLIALRKRHPAFGRGTIEFLQPENRKILAYLRRHGDETLLVVANLSRFAQYAELDLSGHEGRTPIELFGRIDFPTIGRTPYVLTLAPHGFFWFSLERTGAPAGIAGRDGTEPAGLRTIEAPGGLEGLLRGRGMARLTAVLPGYLAARRWFRSKARRMKSAEVVESIPVPLDGRSAHVVLVQVEYSEGDPDVYALPICLSTGDAAARILDEVPHAVIARVTLAEGREALLHDALADPALATALMEAIASRRRFRGTGGDLVGVPTRAFRALRGAAGEGLEPTLSRAEQSNTSIHFGDRLILKVFRRLEAGLNPDLEIGRFLTDRGFANVPAVGGSLEYRPRRGSPMSVAILQAFVPNEGDVWAFTMDAVGEYLERAAAAPEPPEPSDLSTASLLELARGEPPELARRMVDTYLDTAWLLGRRTGELHTVLASEPDDPAFAAEPFTALYQRGRYQAIRSGARQALGLLARNVDRLPEQPRSMALDVIGLERAMDERLRALLGGKVEVTRIRTHGDYHVGQVLYTGRDVVIIDFEGEPGRPLSERRIRRSALTDVAGMLRSFQYAVDGAIIGRLDGSVRSEDLDRLEPWARYWIRHVSGAFLRGYLAAVDEASFVPRSDEDFVTLLDAFLIEKATYELVYELNNRPAWVSIPLLGILRLLRR